MLFCSVMLRKSCAYVATMFLCFMFVAIAASDATSVACTLSTPPWNTTVLTATGNLCHSPACMHAPYQRQPMESTAAVMASQQKISASLRLKH